MRNDSADSVGQAADAANVAPRRSVWVKADLHLHTAEDRKDVVEMSAREVLDRAHRLGYRVLAITLHGEVLAEPDLFSYAEALGIRLIPGAELRIDGADVVVLNITCAEAAMTRTFDDLRRLRTVRGTSVFILAPHPFYRLGGSIGGARLVEHIDLFDAIEYCHFHLPFFNLNRPAVRIAEAHGLPLLATSDAHRRQTFGRSYSWLELFENDNSSADDLPCVQAIFAALRAGRIRRVSPSYGFWSLVSLLSFLFILHPWRSRLRKRRLRQDRSNRVATIDQQSSPSFAASEGVLAGDTAG